MADATDGKAGGASGVVLLAGGNPQIAKGDGPAPVAAYIAAMPGWKRDVGQWIDDRLHACVPDLRMAVKWNSPLYGAGGPDRGWFLGLHCMTRYVKVAFFAGAGLQPPPPEASRQKDVRYLHVHEGALPDAAQFDDWLRQAAARPGARM